jgi:hypothetical protein
MSHPPAHSKSDALVISALALPFMAFHKAGSLIARSLSRNPAATPPAPPAPAPAPVQSAPAAAPAFNPLVPANRVCSAEIDGHNVSFYQYFGAKVIRASCRANRRLQEATFTPAIADECGIAFDLDGAIQWIRERGFGSQRPHASQPGSPRKGSSEPRDDVDMIAPPFDAPFKSAPMARPGREKSKGQPVQAQGATAQPFVHTLDPVAEHQGRPFRGRIQFFGEETRPGRGQDKPYVTYVLRMESESRAYSKDFLGEHLGELVEKYQLKRGQLVTVQLIGREHFQVEVNGKMEDRRRNHYSIKVH